MPATCKLLNPTSGFAVCMLESWRRSCAMPIGVTKVSLASGHLTLQLDQLVCVCVCGVLQQSRIRIRNLVCDWERDKHINQLPIGYAYGVKQAAAYT